MIDPMTVKQGEKLNHHGNGRPVTVLAINRFWRVLYKDLIAGAVILESDVAARTARSLHTFCRQAHRPRR